MKTLKYLGVATLITAGLGLASASHAADIVTFVAAGSSAQFTTFTHAFVDQGYTNHYSSGTSLSFELVDASTANNEPAQVAIYWKGSAGSYQIAVYYQVDSTVGVRSFFNSDTITSPTTLATATSKVGSPGGDNKGYPGTGDVIPPDEVVAALNGTTVNVGATDITPEDARVATARTLALGYNATTNPVTSAVTPKAGFPTSIANPVNFSLTSKPFTTVAVGAVPVMVFVNNGPDFGALAGNNLNIDSFQLAGFLSGQFNRTSDLVLGAGAAQDPVHTYIREPLSGTYNTMEYTNPESLAKLSFTQGKQSGSTAASGGQELNVTTNPLNEPTAGSADPGAPANSGRIRAIGTGELIGAVAGDTTDALGYAFWSTGAFKNKAVKYLTVDGADPIQDSYSGGAVTGAAVTFRNVQNGGYPLWSILRVVEANNAPAAITNIVGQAQNEDGGADYANAKTLRVFRSYHQTPYTVGAVSNGNNTATGGKPANGGDVGGAVFSINNDQDAFNDFAADLSNIRQ